MGFLTSPGCPIDLHTDGSGRATLLRTIRYRDCVGATWEAPGADTYPDRPAVGDGASVPRPLWPIFGHPWHSDHARGGWLHDCEYQKAEPCTVWYAMFCDERAAVDQMFYEAVRDDLADNGEGVWVQVIPKWRLISRTIRWALHELADGDEAYALYLGVRVGGWWSWWKYGRKNLGAIERIRREQAEGR